MTATATREALISAILSAADAASRSLAIAALADLFAEQGDESRAARVRSGDWQATTEGAEIVTVGRYGSRTAKTGNGFGVPVWTTKVYRAVRRADGLLTWRLAAELDCHSTAGRTISGPMLARARAEADSRHAAYTGFCRHGLICD